MSVLQFIIINEGKYVCIYLTNRLFKRVEIPNRNSIDLISNIPTFQLKNNLTNEFIP